jgi:chromosome partitioning protein
LLPKPDLTSLARTLHAREIIGDLSERYGKTIRIFEPVRRSVRFAEAPIVGQSILDYAEDLEGALTYRELAEGLERER